MIDHVGFEVSDLNRSAAFYDVVFHALGGRRMHDTEHAVAYGINGPVFWIVVRGREPGPGYGHIALSASGKAAVDGAYRSGLANGGTADGDTGPPAPRPDRGGRYYACYMLDPDGLRVEVVARR
jgi:catechol 2,3-dioxygenase-like lactoylglutathione lyase family enzyme